jgi:hypothetical protein
MMYNHKLAVALKSAGKVLREFGETVYVPFGSEYSVFVKNLNSVRALVKIEIDGIDVGDGTKFVVDPNRDIDLERFIKNNNLNEGNKFKFIERTDNIENNRGVGIEDGLIRIEFNFERITQPVLFDNSPHWTYTSSGTVNLRNTKNDFLGAHDTAAYNASVNNVASKGVAVSANINDAGITVPGSVSDQEFRNTSWFPTEYETHVIVLQMLGQTEDNQQVTKPVTVKAKSKCVTCGRTNKATAKFCTECGTSLTIV